MDSSTPTNAKTPTPLSDAKVVERDDITRVAEDAFRQSADALSHTADDAPPVKLFGMFEVDPGLAVYAKTAYNVLSDFATKILGKHTETLTHRVLSHTSLEAPAIRKIAAVTTLGANLALKSGGYIGQIIEPFHNQRKARAKLARQLAPVLDDIKGSHSLGALMSLTASQNEVIYAHRRRMSKINHADNFENVIDFAVNVTPNMALSLPQFHGMWAKDMSAEAAAAHAQEAMNKVQGGGDASTLGQLQMLGTTFVGASTAGISNHLKKSNRRKLEKSLQPYSALEMILTLEEQVAQDPNASSFQAPGKNGESYPLEEYIMRLMIQHQKDMADINPQYTELRPALKEDLSTIAHPIAEAIRSGDLSAMTLIRWVGEGKLIKNHGRSVVGVAEVEALLDRAEKKPQPVPAVNSKDYYTEASFNKEDLRTALGSLKGEERLSFAAMFPDSILQEAGIAEGEIKSIREATLKNYDHMLAQAVAGLAAKSDDDLTREGLAKNEIKQLRDAYEQIQGEGEQATHKLKTSPANANGIERTLTNWAVASVKGDKEHIGTLLSRGNQQLAAMPAKEEAATSAADGRHEDDLGDDGHFAKREQRNPGGEAAEAAR